MTKPLELCIRVMEDDNYESGEEPIEGDWKYLRIEELLKDFRRYGVEYEETAKGVQLKNPDFPNRVGAPPYYLLAGRQRDLVRREEIQDEFSPVVKKKTDDYSYSRPWSIRYPHYAYLSLFTPDGKLVAAHESSIIPVKIAILKNVLDLYIELKQIPSFREYPELLESFK